MLLRRQAAQAHTTLLVGLAVATLLLASAASAHTASASPDHRDAQSAAAATPALQDPTQLDTEEAAALVAINQRRQQRHLDPLTLSPQLSHAAQWMVHDLVNQAHLSHIDSRGLALRARVSEFGHPTTALVAENVARGFLNGAALANAMLGSDGHQTNLLRADTPVIAIARAAASDAYRIYWVVIVGSDAAPGSTRHTTHIVPLLPGWNLVSWLGPSAPIAQATATLRPIVQRLWGWSAAANHTHAWAAYQTDGDGQSILTHGEPVWLRIDQPNIAYWGQIIEPRTGAPVALNVGWSLVTWLGADAVALQDATATLTNHVNSLVTFDAPTQRYTVHQPRIAQATPPAILRHGQPLWIHTSRAIVWVQNP